MPLTCPRPVPARRQQGLVSSCTVTGRHASVPQQELPTWQGSSGSRSRLSQSDVSPLLGQQGWPGRPHSSVLGSCTQRAKSGWPAGVMQSVGRAWLADSWTTCLLEQGAVPSRSICRSAITRYITWRPKPAPLRPQTHIHRRPSRTWTPAQKSLAYRWHGTGRQGSRPAPARHSRSAAAAAACTC